MNKTESTENYLERILMLRESGERVHSVDLANALGYSKPSVSNAVKKLQKEGYITVDGHDLLLTETGEAIAQKVYRRHQDLSRYFLALGVSPENAYADACMIEHDISEETYQALMKNLKKIESQM